jgi:transcriptional regulator with XRE-family HTH domain
MRKQKLISQKAKLSEPCLSNILAGRRRPSWSTAKKLETATGIPAVEWIEGRVDREYLIRHLENQCQAA